MVKLLIMVLLLGAVGAICRDLVILSFPHWLPDFPGGTLCVNLLGAYMAGFVFVLFRTKLAHLEKYEPVCLVGFMGGFTTFSSYTLDTIQLITDGALIAGLCNIVAMNVLGLIAAYAGITSARRVYPYRYRYKKGHLRIRQHQSGSVHE